MIIPIYRNPEFKEGDTVISLKEIKLNHYLITPYHEFIIAKIDKDNKGYNNLYTIIDNDSNIVIEEKNLRDFTLKVDLKCAKRRNKELKDNSKICKFIEKNCPHRCDAWEDYSSYYRCDMKNIYGNDSCYIGVECLNHIKYEIIQKDNFILKYLRNKKLKEINENTEI